MWKQHIIILTQSIFILQRPRHLQLHIIRLHTPIKALGLQWTIQRLAIGHKQGERRHRRISKICFIRFLVQWLTAYNLEFSSHNQVLHHLFCSHLQVHALFCRVTHSYYLVFARGRILLHYETCESFVRITSQW